MDQATLERAPTQLVTDHDGWIYDPDSGEVYGITNPETDAVIWLREAGPEIAQVEETRFEIRAEDAADWVLSLILAEEAALSGIAARRAAILANLEGMEVQHQNRIRSIEWRFKNDLEAFARKRIEETHGKSKTLKLPHGKLSFRSSKGTSDITDRAKALAFVEEWAPEKVTKSANVGAVQAAIDRALADMGEEPDFGEFFKQAQPRESFTITTGIGGKD
jgi:hypothetical protein